MRITTDTNVLVRVVVLDDAAQHEAAIEAVETADLVAIPLSSLCELVWVLEKAYRMPRMSVAHALEALLGRSNVEVNRPAVEFGLRVYAEGADFADGAIAFEGAAMGGATMVTFDRKAVAAIRRCGGAVRRPGQDVV